MYMYMYMYVPIISNNHGVLWWEDIERYYCALILNFRCALWSRANTT